MRRRAAPLLAAAALAGCGAERTRPPDVERPGRSFGTDQASFPQAGVALETPRGWQREDGTGPLVTRLSSGEATVAVWRYPRTEPLPAGEAALTAARDALVTAIEQRDPAGRYTGELAELDDQPAVEVRGTGAIDGYPRAFRSVHVFAFGAELVVDAAAPARDLPFVEREVLRPLLRSVRLAQP